MILIFFLEIAIIFRQIKCKYKKLWKIYSHQTFFPSNQLFSDSFSECVALTKFLPENRKSKLPK